MSEFDDSFALLARYLCGVMSLDLEKLLNSNFAA